MMVRCDRICGAGAKGPASASDLRCQERQQGTSRTERGTGMLKMNRYVILFLERAVNRQCKQIDWR
jgi:hypothetical protein